MQLIGMFDSPYVRRVAISAKLLGVGFDHLPLSVFSAYDDFAKINPVVKAPTWVTDEGVALIESALIIEYLEMIAEPGRSLSPAALTEKTRVLSLTGFALAACEKAVQIVYERNLRPAEKLHKPWVDRVEGQLRAAFTALETAAAPGPWLVADRLTQADVATAVSWRFAQVKIPDVAAVDPKLYPHLAAHSERLEALPEFQATGF